MAAIYGHLVQTIQGLFTCSSDTNVLDLSGLDFFNKSLTMPPGLLLPAEYYLFCWRGWGG